MGKCRTYTAQSYNSLKRLYRADGEWHTGSLHTGVSAQLGNVRVVNLGIHMRMIVTFAEIRFETTIGVIRSENDHIFAVKTIVFLRQSAVFRREGPPVVTC